MKKILILLMLSVIVSGCSLPAGLYNVYSNHGMKGFTRDQSPIAYNFGLIAEESADQNMRAEKKRSGKRSKLGDSKYRGAYYNYLRADYLGDVRAKPRILLLSKKMLPEDIAEAKKQFAKDVQNSEMTKKWKRKFTVPREHRRK